MNKEYNSFEEFARLNYDYIEQSGIPHEGSVPHSGRYPWGSGEDPFQHEATTFVDRVNQLRASGFTWPDTRKTITEIRNGKEYTIPNPDYGRIFYGDAAIARSMDYTTKDFKRLYEIKYNESKLQEYNRIKSYAEQGLGATEIARKVYGDPKKESTVRGILNKDIAAKQEAVKATTDFLRNRVDSTGDYIQVGSGTEKLLDISRNRLETSLLTLQKAEGYEIHNLRVKNPTDPTGKHQTTVMVLCPPGTKDSDVYKNIDKIKPLTDFTSDDDGNTFRRKVWEYPASMNSKRIDIRYAEDGGTEQDGIIEIRRNVPDLSLGASTYAQVRILVDGTHYLKGMAMYSDDLPEGIDIRFNTNKPKGTPMLGDKTNSVLKLIKRNKDGTPAEDPFGSALKEENGQYHYIDINGKEKLGLINKTREESDWEDWSNKVPSQFLSKQNISLIQKQLKLTTDFKKTELETILAIDNPTVRKDLLNTFAEDCDSTAVHLKAAQFPRQKYQVILPITSMKDNEVFAPNFDDGEQVALVRYPHGGLFEIPILTVNNNQKEAVKKLTKSAQDCVGINSKIASQLSGADFDGDTVMVIPIRNTRIKNKPPLKELEGFDPKIEYGPDPKLTKVDKDDKVHYYNSAGIEYKIMNNTQTQMGKVSNLITDMTIRGADDKEIADVVKHSMTVIDAEKHHLDYRSSEMNSKISTYKRTYQKKLKDGEETFGGASTLISKAKGKDYRVKTQGQPKVNAKYKPNGEKNPDYDPSRPEGALIFKESDQSRYIKVWDETAYTINKKGEKKYGKWVDAYDQTPKKIKGYKNPEAFNNDPEKMIDKLKKGSYEYIKGQAFDSNGKRIIDIQGKKTVVKNERYKIEIRKDDTTKMEKVDDARSLISTSNTRQEQLYAEFANDMKDLANKARLISYNTKDRDFNKSASITYKKEVDSLKQKLLISEKASPREKQAVVLASSRIEAKFAANDDLTKEEKRKIRQRELTQARAEVGAKRVTIEVTDREWEAIQAGAVRTTTLRSILNHMDSDAVKERAMPRAKNEIPPTVLAQIKRMYSNGYTAAQIQDALGVSTSMIYSIVNNKNK